MTGQESTKNFFHWQICWSSNSSRTLASTLMLSVLFIIIWYLTRTNYYTFHTICFTWTSYKNPTLQKLWMHTIFTTDHVGLNKNILLGILTKFLSLERPQFVRKKCMFEDSGYRWKLRCKHFNVINDVCFLLESFLSISKNIEEYLAWKLKSNAVIAFLSTFYATVLHSDFENYSPLRV